MYPTSHQGDYIHSADIRLIVVKKKCLMHFHPDAGVFALSN